MELLKTIKEKDIIPKSVPNPKVKYNLRKAARAVVFDRDNKIAFLNVLKYNYHTLPGGGLKENENLIDALKRECLEETGCNISIIKEIGIITEYRDKIQQLRKSYCYLAMVEGDKGKPSFTEREIDKGFRLLWVDIDKAIDLLKNDKPNNYRGKFIIVRDLEFLERAKEIM